MCAIFPLNEGSHNERSQLHSWCTTCYLKMIMNSVCALIYRLITNCIRKRYCKYRGESAKVGRTCKFG